MMPSVSDKPSNVPSVAPSECINESNSIADTGSSCADLEGEAGEVPMIQAIYCAQVQPSDPSGKSISEACSLVACVF